MASSRADLSRVSGSGSMAPPGQEHGQDASKNAAAQSSSATTADNDAAAPKKKRHRGGKKHRKTRRQSFIAPSEATDEGTEVDERPSLLDTARTSTQSASLYRMQSSNRSNTSLESEALLDHRDQGPLRQRRSSIQHGFTRASLPFQRREQYGISNNGRGSPGSAQRQGTASARAQTARMQEYTISEDDDDAHAAHDRTPLLSRSHRSQLEPTSRPSSSGYGSGAAKPRPVRQDSTNSRAESRRRIPFGQVDIGQHKSALEEEEEDFDVNNPPSVPNSPKLGSLDDVMINDLSSAADRGRDAIIDIDPQDDGGRRFSSASPDGRRRRSTIADLAERDVCFPGDVGMSEIGEEDEEELRSPTGSAKPRRRRHRHWPDLEILEDWSREEKEERTQEQIRMKKMVEPVMIEGRLRRSKAAPAWHKEVDDAPFRFTYFNEMLDGTIHARTISDLCQEGMTFRDLFIPDPIELSDDSDSEDEDMTSSGTLQKPSMVGLNGRLAGEQSRQPSFHVAETGSRKSGEEKSNPATGTNTPSLHRSQAPTPVQRPFKNRASKRYGPRPTFWLDVLSPTELEMKVLAKAFGIHQLTIEDILMEEEREKVELFQSYYFVNYRSFEQDENNDEYMEPINMYVVVFRDGVITFHHSMTPHPANVRRRIRQLNDYMSPTADWISYAIIDDVTDVYAPLVQQIENEVDEIDDEILYMHQSTADQNLGHQVRESAEKTKRKTKGLIGKVFGKSKNKGNQTEPANQADTGAEKAEGERTAGESGGDMLRRVGECRKKVMGLYRLLGNKADVIKGFAKRCNEHWEVAPRSEIGLYLGDIQDHIVTMTGNLSHYENLLSRAHSNYLAQINIRMNERAEMTADVLGKLTVLGTIVLPMNIVTGMWGMNVWVPGQEYEGDLTWFWCITAGLVAFGMTCFFIAKRVYKIV